MDVWCLCLFLNACPYQSDLWSLWVSRYFQSFPARTVSERVPGKCCNIESSSTLHHSSVGAIYCNQPGATWRRSYQAGCLEGATFHRPRHARFDAQGNVWDGARMCHPPTAVQLAALANTGPCLPLWRTASVCVGVASPQAWLRCRSWPNRFCGTWRTAPL
jgi:hypothetical protein